MPNSVKLFTNVNENHSYLFALLKCIVDLMYKYMNIHPPPINALVTPLDGNGFKNFISNKKLLSLVKTTLSIILDNESNNEIGL